jgi:hypothetical protein
MSRWPAIGALELVYSRAHPGIPAPQVGYAENWSRHHASLPDMKTDHRVCPAIIGRERIGITLSMPFTFRVYRDGRLEAEAPWMEGDSKVHTWRPEQATIKIGPEQVNTFPGYDIELPFPTRPTLQVFALGDIRVCTWTIDSGVVVSGLPSDYTLFIMPLPNHVYPPTYSVSQAVANPRLAQGTAMRLPIDFHLSRLPPGEEAIVIPYKTPVCQYIPLKVPVVNLRPAEAEGVSTPPATRVG